MSESSITSNDWEYPQYILNFLRSKLDDFTVECFKLVVRHNKHGGVVKSKTLEDYFNKRFIYERAFASLEAQGFIEAKELGNMKPYFVTNKGIQLAVLIKREMEENK